MNFPGMYDYNAYLDVLENKALHEKIATLEHERDEARYWLINMMSKHSHETQFHVFHFLKHCGFDLQDHPNPVIDALIAKVEGK